MWRPTTVATSYLGVHERYRRSSDTCVVVGVAGVFLRNTAAATTTTQKAAPLVPKGVRRPKSAKGDPGLFDLGAEGMGRARAAAHPPTALRNPGLAWVISGSKLAIARAMIHTCSLDTKLYRVNR